MCDEHTADDNEHYLAAMSRRQFGVMTGAAGLAMLLPVPADAKPISGRDVSIKTPDGQADAYFVITPHAAFAACTKPSKSPLFTK